MPRDTDFSSEELPAGTELLRGQYRIERRLIDGGFGITYLARDSLDRRVVIKECFPAEISCRSGADVVPSLDDYSEILSSLLRQFQCEARRLAALKHPNIVHVHQIFDENGTSYMAMEFVDGVDLASLMEIEPERFTPENVAFALKQALEAIEYTHSQGILHRDIAPDNLLLGAEEHLTLIDFGSAYDERAGSSNKLLAVKDGYSPHEFYVDGKMQNAASDLYALGATFYFVITGSPPPDSSKRLAFVEAGKPDPYRPLTQGPWVFEASILSTIDRALQLAQENRFQSAAEWLEHLTFAEAAHAPDPVAATMSAPAPAPTTPAVEIIAEDIITQLVSDTNMELTAGMPGDLRKERLKLTGEETVQTGHQEKQYVDIFGNPIKDVDKFLKEQDGRFSKGASAYEKNGSKLVMQIPPDDADDEYEKPRQSLIGKLLGRASRSKRRSSKSAIVQT